MILLIWQRYGCEVDVMTQTTHTSRELITNRRQQFNRIGAPILVKGVLILSGKLPDILSRIQRRNPLNRLSICISHTLHTEKCSWACQMTTQNNAHKGTLHTVLFFYISPRNLFATPLILYPTFFGHILVKVACQSLII